VYWRHRCEQLQPYEDAVLAFSRSRRIPDVARLHRPRRVQRRPGSRPAWNRRDRGPHC